MCAQAKLFIYSDSKSTGSLVVYHFSLRSSAVNKKGDVTRTEFSSTVCKFVCLCSCQKERTKEIHASHLRTKLVSFYTDIIAKRTMLTTPGQYYWYTMNITSNIVWIKNAVCFFKWITTFLYIDTNMHTTLGSNEPNLDSLCKRMATNLTHATLP